MHFTKSYCIVCLLIIVCLYSCSRKKELLFHAGAGQRSSLTEIKEIFEKKYPQIQVNFSYKGSGYFLADIARSKEGDLYMPGEEFYLLQAVERGFVSDYNPQNDIPAYFVTVIITPEGNPKNIQKIEDFTKPGVRVGLGNPKACAIGVWHKKIFEKAGIWDAVQKNAVMSAKCIPELGNAAQHKSIDATIVWSSTAVLYLRDVEIIPIEQKYRGVIRLPVATLNFSHYPKEALLLKNFILSHQGREIFHKHSYSVNQSIPVDEQSFCVDGTTDGDINCLINAAAVVKSESDMIDTNTVGHLVGEVERQLKTKRSGT